MCTITTSFHRLGERLRSIAPVFLLCYYTGSTIFLLSACLETISDATCEEHICPPIDNTPITRHYHVGLPGINIQALAFGEARGSKERFDVQTISTVSCVNTTTTIDEHLRTHRRQERTVPPQHPCSPHALRLQNACLNCNLHRGQSQEYSN
ncbi:hypothetical protein DFH29DRAFT_926325, partial [Suillus ampliporus]